MSLLARPAVATRAAKTMQGLTRLAGRRSDGPGSTATWQARFPAYPRDAREATVPTSVAPAPVTIYAPRPSTAARPPVHVNFHGGGYVMSMPEMDDALCRILAVEAGVVVVNVKYVVAPQHPFPAPTTQAYDVVRWVAGHGAEQGWDGGRLQRRRAERGRWARRRRGPPVPGAGRAPLALQVLHYPRWTSRPAPATRRPTSPSRCCGPGWRMSSTPRTCRTRVFAPTGWSRPCGASDTADLRGIAPALVITAEYDLLRAEGERYAGRLAAADALVEHHEVAGADHAYDSKDDEKARATYLLIARHLRRATAAPGVS